jgi:hypothetical protein
MKRRSLNKRPLDNIVAVCADIWKLREFCNAQVSEGMAGLPPTMTCSTAE